MAGDDGWAGRGFSGQVSGMAECPGCGGLAEPEQDGDVTYWSCGCGVDFGYQVVRQQEETCAAGLTFSEIEAGPKLERVDASVFLGSTITRRPDVPS